MCTIVSENRESGYCAAKKLIEAGHRKIGFLGAPSRKSSPASEERFEGFKSCCDDFGIQFEEQNREDCEYWYESAGYEGMKKLYAKSPDITAVFVVCDALAFGAMSYLTEVGKSVPDDISIIGFDDDIVDVQKNLFLTTFRQNREKIAELSAEILLQVIAGLPVPGIVRVPTEFIERKSVKQI